MTTLIHMNDAQYKTKLTGFIKSQTTQRDNCQILIVEGIRQYIASGRTTRLSSFFSQSVAVASIPTVTILAFIKEHANLTYTKNKVGDYMFKKDDKSDVVSSLPTENWYAWNKAKHNDVKDVDYKKRVTNSLKQAIKHDLSGQAMMEALLDSGLTTSQLLSMIDANSKAIGIAA
jgi:hypothetical protein